MRLPRLLWSGYTRQLQQRPMLIKASTSALTFTCTDCIAQWRERQRRLMPSDASRARDKALSHDFPRTVRNGLFGFLWLCAARQEHACHCVDTPAERMKTK